MIRASQLLDILEEWLMGFKGDTFGEHIDVFENPTRLEMNKEMGKDIRFFADNRSKRFYAWNAFHAIHYDVIGHLHLEGARNSGEVLSGLAEKHGTSYVMTQSDFMDSKDGTPQRVNKILSQDWSWADRYVEISSWIAGQRAMRK
jgi:hypothetical protein